MPEPAEPTAVVATWNVEWARPDGARGRSVTALLQALHADVLCVSEGVEAILPPGGHVVTSGPDYGYPVREGRRKVLLWSRRPWSEVDAVGHPAAPPGRFVAGVTETPVGPLRVIGACIPWSMAHVAGGRRDRRPWDDHLAYLAALGEILARTPPDPPAVLTGDWNQRIPPLRGRPPRRAAEALAAALGVFEVVTAGEVGGAGGPLIDHIALGPGLDAIRVDGWPADAGGSRLSDHSGVAAEVIASRARPGRPATPVPGRRAAG